MKYRDSLFEQANDLKKEIVGSCKTCKGQGYTYSEKLDDTIDCDCLIIFVFISRLVFSEISKEYWNLNYKELKVNKDHIDLLDFYFKYLANAFVKNKGILFMGNNGSGKTSLMAEIGKEYISQDYRVKYFTQENYINALKNNDLEFIDEINNSQVLLLDEIGKSYSKADNNYVSMQVENFIRNTITKKVLIGSTNYDMTELSNLLGDSTLSVLNRHLKSVLVSDDDFSEVIANNWKTELEENYNYYHKNIMSKAKILNGIKNNRRKFIDNE